MAVFIAPERTGGMDLLSFQLDLAARLEEDAGLPVDVVLLNEAPLGLRASVLCGRLLHSRDEARRISLLEHTGLEVMDMTFLARESLRDLLGV